MDIKNLFLSTLNIVIFFSIFYLIFKINYLFREDILFGSQIFLTDLVAKDEFSALTKFISIILISIFLLALFNLVINKYKNIFSRYSKQQIFMIILAISFLLKLTLLGFTLHQNDDVEDMVNILFINGEFKEYKLYNLQEM